MRARRLSPAALLAIVSIVAFVVGVWVYREPLWQVASDADALVAWVKSLGPLGPLGVLLLQVLQLVIAPLPSPVITMVAAYLYGFWGGLALTVLGAAIGTTVVLAISRRFGRPFVERFANERAMAFVGQFDTARSPLVWALVFGLPIGDALTFAAGLTRVPIGRLVLGAVLGRLPFQLLAAFFGAESNEYGMWGWVAGIAMAVALTVILTWNFARINAVAITLARRQAEEPSDAR